MPVERLRRTLLGLVSLLWLAGDDAEGN